jgi:hypothetical protein
MARHVCGEERRMLQRFRNWCRPNPDFLWGLVASANFMRLSLRKGAHAALSSAVGRKSGKAKDSFVVFSQGKPLLAIFIRPP